MIRRPTDQDHQAITELLDHAFQPSKAESRIRDRVVKGRHPFEEWLVEVDGKVVAYILYTQASRGSTVVGYHLAPIAVHPDFQGYGIGSQLISDTLDRDPIRDESVFVLGDPDFYERFGFARPDSASCPFDPDNRHFRALRWEEPASPFTVGYVPAFEEAVAG
jgi:putative acetyltransferase